MNEPRLKVVFWDEAAKQLEAASEWWHANRPGAPNAILEELLTALTLVSKQPDAGTTATNLKLARVRRVLLGRVGYYLYYRLAPAQDAIEVLAFGTRGEAAVRCCERPHPSRTCAGR